VGIADIVSTAGRSSAAAWIRPLVLSPSLLQNFGNLRWINRRRHVATDDLHLAASRLVCDRRDFSFDNFAAVEADPDAGAYALPDFHDGPGIVPKSQHA
jgi:hypothetical protein